MIPSLWPKWVWWVYIHRQLIEDTNLCVVGENVPLSKLYGANTTLLMHVVQFLEFVVGIHGPHFGWKYNHPYYISQHTSSNFIVKLT